MYELADRESVLTDTMKSKDSPWIHNNGNMCMNSFA